MPGDAPTVTVCIPTYNYADLLGGAISSVLGQTFEDFELLVADDVSTDNTAAVVEQFLDDPRVRWMPNEVNRGMFANFNRCIDVARGRYIKFLMADDWLAAEFLERMVELLEQHPDVDFATSGGWLIDEDGEVFGEEMQRLGEGPVVPRSRVIEESVTGFNVVGMPTNTLIRTAAIRAVGGFDAEYQPSADLALWLRLLTHSDLAWLPARMSYLRIHDAHTHDWGDDPHEIDFKVWGDAARIPDGAVDRATAERAQRKWSARYLAYGANHLIGGNRQSAGRLWRVVADNVGVRVGLFELLLALPWLLRGRWVTVAANRAGDSIVYAPHPTRGRPLVEVRAEAEAAKSEALIRATTHDR